MTWKDKDNLLSGWFYEFTGLFMGEGCANIIRNGARSYSPCLSIRLRDDDAPMIEFIQQRLGGRLLHRYLHSKNPKHGNQIEWRTTNLQECEKICLLLIQHQHLGARKLNDVEAVYSFCVWRRSCKRYFTEEEREEAEFRMQALRQSRLYRL
jgi:hypothetical protein